MMRIFETRFVCSHCRDKAHATGKSVRHTYTDIPHGESLSDHYTDVTLKQIVYCTHCYARMLPVYTRTIAMNMYDRVIRRAMDMALQAMKNAHTVNDRNAAHYELSTWIDAYKRVMFDSISYND